MFLPPKRKPFFLIFPWVAAVASFFVITTSFALPEDSQKPLHVDAQYSHGDLKKNIVTHKGNVVIIQGSTKLTGDTVVVKLNEKNELIKGISTGKPATYRTLTAPDKPEFYAEAHTIEYLLDKQLILLIGNAKVRQGNNTYEGPRLEYLIDQQIVISPKSPAGRATMVIYPNEKNA